MKVQQAKQVLELVFTSAFPLFSTSAQFVTGKESWKTWHGSLLLICVNVHVWQAREESGWNINCTSIAHHTYKHARFVVLMYNASHVTYNVPWWPLWPSLLLELHLKEVGYIVRSWNCPDFGKAYSWTSMSSTPLYIYTSPWYISREFVIHNFHIRAPLANTLPVWLHVYILTLPSLWKSKKPRNCKTPKLLVHFDDVHLSVRGCYMCATAYMLHCGVMKVSYHWVKKQVNKNISHVYATPNLLPCSYQQRKNDLSSGRATFGGAAVQREFNLSKKIFEMTWFNEEFHSRKTSIVTVKSWKRLLFGTGSLVRNTCSIRYFLSLRKYACIVHHSYLV